MWEIAEEKVDTELKDVSVKLYNNCRISGVKRIFPLLQNYEY